MLPCQQEEEGDAYNDFHGWPLFRLTDHDEGSKREDSAIRLIVRKFFCLDNYSVKQSGDRKNDKVKNYCNGAVTRESETVLVYFICRHLHHLRYGRQTLRVDVDDVSPWI